EILHGSGDEHLAGLRRGFHACRDVYADASDVVPATFDLARVDARADLQTQAPDAAAQGHGARDGARGPIERGQHAIPGALQPRPVEAAYLPPREFVM